MNLHFEPISLARQDEYRERLALVPQLTSDYSFVNLYAWAEEYGLTWAWGHDFVWIRQEEPVAGYWAPVGNWHHADEHLFSCLPEKLPFFRVPEQLANLWHGDHHQFDVHEAREHWDYLYSVQELIELKGNRFHKKKNLLRQFKNKYVYEYLALNNEFIEQVLSMQLDWCAWRNCEASAGLSAENRVIAKVLKSYDSLRNMYGGAIRSNNRIIAFTVGECLGPDTMVIHFEKGIDGYKGIYQAINQMFLAAHSDFHIVNREQDLGNEGLRNAKMSYGPLKFLKKYELRWR